MSPRLFMGFLLVLQLCSLLLLSVDFASCEPERFCGPKLSEALQFICGSKFARITKKSFDPIDYYSELEREDPYALEEMPFLSQIAKFGLARTRPRRAGVYDECCRKPCSRSELQSYCL